MENCIRVWPFRDAPQKYKDLSKHRGDEDWVAFIPNEIYENHGIPLWMDSNPAFGCAGCSQHFLAEECGQVVIGAHA